MCFCNFGSFCPAKIFSKNSALILFSSNLSVKLGSHGRRQGSNLLKHRKQSHSATNLHLHTCSTSPATFIFTFLPLTSLSHSKLSSVHLLFWDFSLSCTVKLWVWTLDQLHHRQSLLVLVESGPQNLVLLFRFEEGWWKMLIVGHSGHFSSQVK